MVLGKPETDEYIYRHFERGLFADELLNFPIVFQFRTLAEVSCEKSPVVESSVSPSEEHSVALICITVVPAKEIFRDAIATSGQIDIPAADPSSQPVHTAQNDRIGVRGEARSLIFDLRYVISDLVQGNPKTTEPPYRHFERD